MSDSPYKPQEFHPAATTTSNRYSRLFAADLVMTSTANDVRLGELAASMETDETPIPTNDWFPKIGKQIPAGYTYFGQFIDHDLTHDLSDLPQNGLIIDPTMTMNYRTSFLNLDSLYGDGPYVTKPNTLYEENRMSFRLGVALSNGRCFDVPLDDECRPQTADPRNIENAILRQLHAMFLQLHNIAVRQIKKEGQSGDFFSDARRLVQHQFQWLVRNDFIPAVCNEPVAEAVRAGKGEFINWQDKQFSIPVEFAQAAFRFGHSMVKHEYKLGDANANIPLASLFGGSQSRGALMTKFAVNWDRFLAHGNDPADFEFAAFIDTGIAKPLFYIPLSSIETFAPSVAMREKIQSNERMLPWRTLKRGALCQLSSGQRAAEKLCPGCQIQGYSSNYSHNPWQHLIGCGLDKDTPLWYYILLEAQLNEVGIRLGTIGSLIVAGTLEAALRSNPTSYLHEDPDDWPKEWTAWDGSKIFIEDLHDVARVVGLAAQT